MSSDVAVGVAASGQTPVWSGPAAQEDMSRCLNWRTGDWCAASVDEPVSAMQVSARVAPGGARQAGPKVQVPPLLSVSHQAHAASSVSGHAQLLSSTHHKLPHPRLLHNRLDEVPVPMASELHMVGSITLFILTIMLFMYLAYDYYTRWAAQRQERHRQMLHAKPGKVLSPYSLAGLAFAPRAPAVWSSRLALNPQPPSGPLFTDAAKPEQTPPELAAAIKLAAAGAGD